MNMTSSGAAVQALQQRQEMLESLGIQRGGKKGGPEECWLAVADAFDRLLLPGEAVHESATAIEFSPEQRRADEELEVAGLDALCDAVLTQCASAPDNIRRRLVRIVDCGVDRPIPPEGYYGGEHFGDVCLRKLYVLCSRGGEAEGPHACTLSIARHALPVLIHRCESILSKFAQDDLRVNPAAGPLQSTMARSRLDEAMCAPMTPLSDGQCLELGCRFH